MANKSRKAAPAETEAAAAGESPAALFSGYGDLADLGRENLAAVIQANAALSAGFEEIGKEIFFYARSSFERYAATAAALLGARTLEDVVQLQAEFAQGSIERLFERSAKLSELGLKLATEALAPLGGRVEATVQRLAKPVAA